MFVKSFHQFVRIDAVHRSRFDYITAEHRLAAGKQYKADTELIRLVEDAEPLVACELRDRLAVERRVVTAGVASGAMQIALTRDACDQKRRDMLTLFSDLFLFLDAARLAAANFSMKALSRGFFSVAFSASNTTRYTPFVIYF